MDTKKFDYTDLIDMDCKNQTAKLLENYFHRMRGEYDSIVAVEEETYSAIKTNYKLINAIAVMAFINCFYFTNTI